ncbi:MAG: aldehyde dehydrogenase family protein, partial [Hyphomonadaceae bacterium]|nr:aldehyde dehydrogenase family protein [Hyphomonadaceae bacterium]
MRAIQNFINGKSASANGGRAGRVFDPNTGAQQAEVAFSAARDVDAAVQAALKALPDWSATNPQRRARVMFAFKQLVEKNMDELAHLLSSEHGKVIA